MKQITEDYCGFGVSKLLKEKGFDIPCRSYYNNNDYLSFEHPKGFVSVDSVYLLRPTHQMALKWLREVHNLHITIKPYITVEGIMYLFEIYKLEAEKFTLIKTKTGFEKSEQAVEAALKYTLENLI